MSALRQAIGAAYPAHNMDPDTVASITRAMQKLEMREKVHIIAAPDLLAALQRIANGQEMSGVFTFADVVLRYQEIARAAIARATGELA
jgi:hypothetical protein